MPFIITFEPLGKTQIQHREIRLFDAIRAARLPLASACDGEALCARCVVQILSGEENLEEIDKEEARLLARIRAAPDERMACKTLVRGDVTLKTSYW